MLRGHMELPSETRGIAVGEEIVLLTEEEFEALEARKPQVPAEVIARTQGALIGWQNADEFDAEELQEHGDVLRDATRALLAAVEAAPEPAPDFAAMSPDELRAWLDERGRRSVWRPHNALLCAALNALTGTTIAEVRGWSDEPAALRALCRKVAAKEAS